MKPKPTHTSHKDGRGDSTRWPCGCKRVRRGAHSRWVFCDKHAKDVTDSWAIKTGAP